MSDLTNIIPAVASGTYGNWGNFWTLARLDFSIQGTPENETSKIYANSKNMVEAVITVEILDKSNNGLNLTDDEIKNQLYFCRSETGEDLALVWLISNEPNEYLNGTSTYAKLDDNRRIIRKYISCDNHGRDQITEKISVGINVPGFGKFDTSRYGTTTKMGSGRVFKSPKACEILALRPIDYAIRENVTIESSQFESVQTGMKWVSRLTTEGPLKTHSNGECKRRIVYIKPNQALTGQQKFMKHEIVYDAIHNSNVSTGEIWWWWGTDKHEPCFTLVNQGGGFGRPGAVIGRGKDEHGVDSNNYEVNLWYSRQNRVGINGNFHVVGSDYYYRFNDNGHSIDKNHFGEDENGVPSLVLYKLIMPVYGLWKWKWENCVRDITVKVTDIFGNEGSVKLLFNDTDRFDEPGLK